MIIAIHQPNYLPWLGLISKIKQCDIFIVFDDVKLPRGKNFITRTKIKTVGGTKWIRVPVKEKSLMHYIKDVQINYNLDWREEHWNKIYQNYKSATYFQKLHNRFEEIIKQEWDLLLDLNVELIKTILNILSIKTKVLFASEFGIKEKGTLKILELIKVVGGNQYLSGEGKGSMRYVIGQENLFSQNGIEVKCQEFIHPTYPQIHGEFVPNLSILDMIFNIGPDESIKKLNLN